MTLPRSSVNAIIIVAHCHYAGQLCYDTHQSAIRAADMSSSDCHKPLRGRGQSKLMSGHLLAGTLYIDRSYRPDKLAVQRRDSAR